MKKIIKFIAVLMVMLMLSMPMTVLSATKTTKISKTKITSATSTISSVRIKWKKIAGANGYEIYQKKGSGKYTKVKIITSGSTTTFTKKGLSSATKYTYKIKAYDKVGSKKVYSNFSTEKVIYTKAKKTSISSVSATSSSVKLKWKKVSGANGYEIYQKKGSGKYTKVKIITSGNTTSFTKKELSSSTKYTYKIRVYDKVGSKKVYSDYSTEKVVYTKAKKTSISSVSATSSSVKLKWKKVSGANGYEIYQKKGSGKYTKIKTITSGSTISFTKKGLSSGTKYTYKIRVYDKVGSKKVYSDYSKEKAVNTKKVKNKKTWIVATDTMYKPFEYIDANGNLVGIDVDILEAIAKDQGFKYELKGLGWDSSIAACVSGQADAMIAGASITEARENNGWIFSDGYYSCTQSIIVGSNSYINSFNDLYGKSVAVKVGTQGATLAESLMYQYGFSIKYFEDSPSMYYSVMCGMVDACLDDTALTLVSIKDGNLPLKVLENCTVETSEYGAAIFDSKNQEFLNMFNEGLKNIKANGKYDEIINKYLG